MRPSLALRVAGTVFRLTDWCQDKWTSSNGKLPRKRRHITEKNVESGVKHQTINHKIDYIQVRIIKVSNVVKIVKIKHTESDTYTIQRAVKLNC